MKCLLFIKPDLNPQCVKIKLNVIIPDNESNAQGDRVLVQQDTASVDISSGCNPTNGLPTAVETIVLVKKGVYPFVLI